MSSSPAEAQSILLSQGSKSNSIIQEHSKSPRCNACHFSSLWLEMDATLFLTATCPQQHCETCQ